MRLIGNQAPEEISGVWTPLPLFALASCRPHAFLGWQQFEQIIGGTGAADHLEY